MHLAKFSEDNSQQGIARGVNEAMGGGAVAGAAAGAVAGGPAGAAVGAVTGAASAGLSQLGSNVYHDHKQEIHIIGIREGEKMHETLVTREELMKAEDNADFYRINNLKKIDYAEFYSLGKYENIPEEGYTSKNTHRLTLDETKDLLLSINEIKKHTE